MPQGFRENKAALTIFFKKYQGQTLLGHFRRQFLYTE